MQSNQQRTMLTITRCDIEKGQKKEKKDYEYKLMLNPKSMKKDKQIRYAKEKTFGIIGMNSKFQMMPPENIEFSFTIDGTGVVKQITSVSDELTKLCNVVCYYDNQKHEPNRVVIRWGELNFPGRLTKMDVKYTLFLPNGDPLRAEVTLAFSSFMTGQEEKRKTNKSSPDLSHMVEVKAGDTLPLLCHRIYQDASYYPEVARINNIVNIRELKPGDKLHFPPLR